MRATHKTREMRKIFQFNSNALVWYVFCDAIEKKEKKEINVRIIPENSMAINQFMGL